MKNPMVVELRKVIEVMASRGWLERSRLEQGTYLRPLMYPRSYHEMQPFWNNAMKAESKSKQEDFEIRSSTRHGFGVFARRNFAAKQYLAIVHRGAWQFNVNQHTWSSHRHPTKISYMFELGVSSTAFTDKLFAVLNPMDENGDLIDDPDNLASRINNPCSNEEANVRFVHRSKRPPWEVWVQTTRSIHAGDELLGWYGPNYDLNPPTLPIPSSSSMSTALVKTT